LEEVSGSSPQNSILIHCGLYIYMLLFEPMLTLEYGLTWKIPPNLVEKFWWIVLYIWQTGGLAPANPFSNFEFWLLGILGHFPTAMWQPMTRPHDGHSLAHVTLLHGHDTSPLPHHPSMSPVGWLYGLPHGYTNFHMALSHWSMN
jgi:hypothetical protein